MKIPIEVWMMVAVAVLPLVFIQTLHTMSHSDHCKTEAEWRRLNKD